MGLIAHQWWPMNFTHFIESKTIGAEELKDQWSRSLSMVFAFASDGIAPWTRTLQCGTWWTTLDPTDFEGWNWCEILNCLCVWQRNHWNHLKSKFYISGLPDGSSKDWAMAWIFGIAGNAAPCKAEIVAFCLLRFLEVVFRYVQVCCKYDIFTCTNIWKRMI